VSKGIEPELLGESTIVWWENVKHDIGTPVSTKIFYKLFRKVILEDME
jgi:hypothetical protein